MRKIKGSLDMYMKFRPLGSHCRGDFQKEQIITFYVGPTLTCGVSDNIDELSQEMLPRQPLISHATLMFA